MTKDEFRTIKDITTICNLVIGNDSLMAVSQRNYKNILRIFHSDNPVLLDAIPESIEAFFYKRRSRPLKNWCSEKQRIRATAGDMHSLAAVYKKIEALIDGYRSPFHHARMSQELRKKIMAPNPRLNGKLEHTEVAESLEYLDKEIAVLSSRDRLKSMRDRAVFYLIVTSGIRKSGLEVLRWGLFRDSDKYSTRAKEYAYACFEEQLNRMPQKSDAVFWGLPSFNGEKVRPMTGFGFMDIMPKLGKRLYAANVLKRKIRFTTSMLKRTFEKTYDGSCKLIQYEFDDFEK